MGGFGCGVRTQRCYRTIAAITPSPSQMEQMKYQKPPVLISFFTKSRIAAPFAAAFASMTSARSNRESGQIVVSGQRSVLQFSCSTLVNSGHPSVPNRPPMHSLQRRVSPPPHVAVHFCQSPHSPHWPGPMQGISAQSSVSIRSISRFSQAAQLGLFRGMRHWRRRTRVPLPHTFPCL